MNTKLAGLFALAAAWLAFAPAAYAQASGQAVYEGRCKVCHEGGDPRAPTREDLGRRAPDDIVHALTTGIMAPMAAGLSDAEKQAVAAYLTSAGAPTPPPPAPPPVAQRPTEMPQVAIRTGPVGTDPMCAANPPIRRARAIPKPRTSRCIARTRPARS